MAQNFRNQLTHSAIGTSYFDILAQANSYDTVVGIRLVNTHASSAINVTVAIENNYCYFSGITHRQTFKEK